MTAGEIRDIVAAIANHEVGPAPADGITAVMMCEIAAQLAELNANLIKIFQAHSPNSMAPRLRVEKLD